MKIQAIGNKIIVRRSESPDKSEGGLLLPGTLDRKSMEGTVVSVGSGSIDKEGNRVPISLEEGDVLVFGAWSGDEINVNGEDLLVLTEDNVIGIVR